MGSAVGNGRRALAEEVPVGYKRTEVGVIPEEWDVASLGEMANIATGGTPPTHDSTYYGDEYPFVSPVDLGEAKYVTHTEKGLSQKGFTISATPLRNLPAPLSGSLSTAQIWQTLSAKLVKRGCSDLRL